MIGKYPAGISFGCTGWPHSHFPVTSSWIQAVLIPINLLLGEQSFCRPKLGISIVRLEYIQSIRNIFDGALYIP